MTYKLLILFFGIYALTCTMGLSQSNQFAGFSTFDPGQGARNVGLSESNGAGSEQNLSAWMVNPALIYPLSWSNVGIHTSFFTAGIQSFTATALVSRDSTWPIAVGLSRLSFGETARYDVEGNPTGNFKSSITEMRMGTRRQLDNRIYIGLGMNYNWRVIDFYNSHILHFDLGGVFEQDGQTSYGITLSGLGYEIIPFETQRDKLPMDVSVYWKQKLNYLPFTFYLRMQKLNLWNRLTYKNKFQNGDQNLNDPEETPSRLQSFSEEILRHMVLGGEFAFGSPEKIWLRFSYDHLRNQQLGIPAIRSLEGVAVGFGVQLKVLRLDYTWERLYFDTGSHQISLAFRLFEKNRRRRGF